MGVLMDSIQPLLQRKLKLPQQIKANQMISMRLNRAKRPSLKLNKKKRRQKKINKKNQRRKRTNQKPKKKEKQKQKEKEAKAKENKKEQDDTNKESQQQDRKEESEKENDAFSNSQEKDNDQNAVAATYWYYKDPEGTLQGPYSSQEMNDWYTEGYFDKHLKVAQVLSQDDPKPTEFFSLRRLSKKGTITLPFNLSLDGREDEYRKPKKDKEEEKSKKKKNKEKEKEQEQEKEAEKETKTKETIKEEVPSTPTNGIEVFYYYKDPEGNLQGPHSAEEMSDWYEEGYFSDSLPIGKTTSANAPTPTDFLSLDSLSESGKKSI